MDVSDRNFTVTSPRARSFRRRHRYSDPSAIVLVCSDDDRLQNGVIICLEGIAGVMANALRRLVILKPRYRRAGLSPQSFTSSMLRFASQCPPQMKSLRMAGRLAALS